MSLVSVIIPNYNHAQYLEQRIETVLNQTYPDVEVIILDDCSTDDSVEIIEKYRGHPKVSHIVYNEVNGKSTFKQWEKGIGLCSGKYVWIAESDDWCEYTFLEEILNGMMHADDCVVGYCQSYCMEDTNVIRWQSAHGCLQEYLGGRAFIEKHMLSNTAIFNASMAVWRKDAFPLISKEFANYRYCGDWLFWIELCMHGNVFVSGKLLNYFRQHAAGVTSKANLSGGQFVEELTMFSLLNNRKWISDENLLTIFKRNYIHYQSIKSSLQPSVKKQIEDLFYREPTVKNYLRRFYMSYYPKQAIKKVFNAIIS